MYRLGLVHMLVNHANMKKFGLVSLHGACLGYMPPQLKFKTNKFVKCQNVKNYLAKIMQRKKNYYNFEYTLVTLTKRKNLKCELSHEAFSRKKAATLKQRPPSSGRGSSSAVQCNALVTSKAGLQG